MIDAKVDVTTDVDYNCYDVVCCCLHTYIDIRTKSLTEMSIATHKTNIEDNEH